LDNIKQVNEMLELYTDANCINCYASVMSDGRVHLDDKFEIKHLKDIMKILEELEK
jgi:hypothetical protein